MKKLISKVRGLRGALGLLKATWKKDEDKWEAADVKVGDDAKVWLLMAQGQENIYLMPAVRDAEWWGKDSYCLVGARNEKIIKT